MQKTKQVFRKFRGITEAVAVMEVARLGVTTRSARRALSMDSDTQAKRRKIDDESRDNLKFASSSYFQVKSRRRRLRTKPENSTTLPAAEFEERHSSSNNDQSAPSCCSSNRSSELEEDSIKFLDRESAGVETSTTHNCSVERRRMKPSGELMTESSDTGSTARQAEASSSCRELTEKKATELELEEFFATAEKDIQERFVEKYNYDIVKDMPLEGRYEWVRLKP